LIDPLRSILTLHFRNSYSHFFGARGAKVVVNDVSAASAQKVVDEIKAGEFLREARVESPS
jgi:hypothetical protein